MEPRTSGNGCQSSFVVRLLLCAGLAGCSPAPPDGEGASHLFSGVEIIGSRGTGAGQFNKPRSLALDRDDHLYVVDMTGRVQKFSPQGVFLASWRLPETDLGKPKGMCRDSAGRIVVIEPHYQRLNHFAPDGRLARQWGATGTNAGLLSMPRDVAADARGHLYVCEYGAVDRVQAFTADGRSLLACFGRPGAAPGEFNRAEGLGIDGRDRVHVADSCNHRVQVFGPDGRWQSAYGRPGRGAGELSYPYDVAIDAAGLAFVCEFGNSRIQVFDTEGRSREILGGPGSAPGRLNNPWCVALDSQGNLYVADSGNHRVQKWVRREPRLTDAGDAALRPRQP